MTLGAAIGATVPVVPEWADANDADSIGGIMSAMLKPAGGFGKFVTLIIALSVISNTAPSIYSVSLNFQILIPKQEKIPRILYVIIATGILIGVAIGAAEDFMRSLESFLFIIAYWSAAFCGVYLTEWIWFRKRNAQTMDPEMWNKPKELPSGFAALGGLIIPFAFVIPSMDQVWYVGPIAKVTGDLGFEFAFITSIPIYILLRTVEIKYFRNGRL
jgi:purine-cytosine permease-like protein